MMKLDPAALYFCLEYDVINPTTKTLQGLRYALRWDNDAGQFSKPQLEEVPPSRLLIRYHIGDKAKINSNDQISWSHTDVLVPCEDMLKANGYTVVQF